MIRSKDAAPDSTAADAGVEGNTRLTASTAVVLFILLAIEGVTLLSRRALLTPHVVIGALLIPPIALKIGSTGYRFLRYYGGAPAYRRKGPPPWLLRVLGPVVVVLTVILIGSGVALLLAAPSQIRTLRDVHKLSFVAWFFAMAVHVLGHLLEMAQIGPADWLGRMPRVPGARWRRGALIASVGAGAVIAVVLAPHVGPFVSSLPFRFEE